MIGFLHRHLDCHDQHHGKVETEQLLEYMRWVQNEESSKSRTTDWELRQ